MKRIAFGLVLLAVATTAQEDSQRKKGGFRPPTAREKANAKKRLPVDEILRRKNVQKMEEMVDSMDTEEQIDFMIDHLEAEKEAEERQDQFAAITPMEGEIVTPNQENGELVLEEQAAEMTEDWSTVPNEMFENTPDAEDTMTEDQWLEYYDENLAVSGVGEEKVAELEEMKEQLQAGEQIDMQLEQAILEDVKEEIESGSDLISLQSEIVKYATDLYYWAMIWFTFTTIGIGFLLLVCPKSRWQLE